MVAGENAEAAGIIRDRFVKSELGREIRDRSFDGRCSAGLSVSVLTDEIISESIVDLLQFSQERFVLGELFQARLSRKLQHSYRIVIRSIPQIGIEMTEKPARRRLPRPPKVEGHFPKWLQRSGQS